MLLAASISLMAMEPLVSGEWLKEHLNDKDLVVLDISSKISYKKGHIPGAVQTDIKEWRKAHGKYALVRPLEEVESLMRELGINNGSRVVVYSHHSNAKDILKPAYAVWAMELYGMKSTAILDGGIESFKRAGGKLQRLPVKRRAGDFKAEPDMDIVIDLDGVKERIGSARMLDARPAVFYFGAEKQKVLKRAGHISGATSYFWRYSFNSDGTIKPRIELKKMLVDGLGLDPQKELVTYCTGGLETSMNYFVLHRLLGFKKAKLYDASMREWANRDDTPMRLFMWE